MRAVIFRLLVVAAATGMVALFSAAIALADDVSFPP